MEHPAGKADTEQTQTEVVPHAMGRPALPILVLLGVLAISFNLRLALASVAPVLPAIRHDLLLSRAIAGLLTTIPVACMGIFAPFAVRLGIRWGTERAIAGSIAVLGIATLARGIGANPFPLYGATLVIGFTMAIMGTLLSGFIKSRFSSHAALVTGLYTASLGLGAAIAASGTTPLATLLGGSWAPALSAWGIPGLGAAMVWVLWVGIRRGPPSVNVSSVLQKLPWGDQKARLITLVFTLQSLVYYAFLAWLTPAYREHGWSAERAGLLLSLLSLVQICGSVIGPALANRSLDRRPWLVSGAVMLAVGSFLVAVVPLQTPWLGASLVGFGIGIMFPLALTLPLDYAQTPEQASATTAMVLGVGYVLAATSPFAVGVLRDVSGSYETPFVVTAVIAALAAVTCVWMRPPEASPR